ncbi:MAG: hypothetical protein C0399_04925 [Syntrophus sp. (in: bacteria)]|nr:hypothetical protein [Syntrophus sp. (in: bacteria)]
MAPKTTSAPKTKPAVKPAPKKPAAKQTVSKKGMKYSCSVCGMVVAVDTACGCAGVCDLICCSMPMKVKK